MVSRQGAFMPRRSPLTPYPRGWFMVALSSELPPGAVLPLHYFGQELVLFRTESGHARLFDAYCPHLGAHLGHGGRVVGEQIQCPFHRWEYDCSGKCVVVPYASKIPPGAKVRAWPVDEVNGMVLAWFHEELVEPTWRVPPIDMGNADEWTPFFETRWKVRTCIQDVNENDLDSAHLRCLHQFTSKTPEEMELQPNDAQLDIRFTLLSNLESFGMAGTAKGPLDTTKYGLGIGWVRYRAEIEGMGISLGTRTLGATTPIDDEHVDIRLFHNIKKTQFDHVTEMLEKQYVKTFKETVEQDIRIWENKRHLLRPSLCQEDGPIASYRRWARQFYSEAEMTRALAR
jgi:3-ketosteroid 9alpha-monooxygenase subunit A